MLPFGSTIYGSMAGGSPRAGINLATRDSAESLGGMGIGAGAGAAVGAGLGALTRNPEAIRGGAGIGAVLGGIPGGILGGMHGSAASADNWNAEHGNLLDKLRGLLSKSAYALVFADMVKQADHIDTDNAMLSGLLPGIGPALYSGGAGDSARSGINAGARSLAEGAGGGTAGAGIGALIAALLKQSPRTGAMIGGDLGATAGSMHGAAASAENSNLERGNLIDKLRGLLSKSAYNLRIPRFPEFEETINSDFHTLEQPYTKRIVFADRDIPDHLEHRIGDKWSVESNENLDTASPMQLYNLSQERGVDNLFEHGVVGSLTQTYDSMQLVDKYLPDLENALDRLGRMLFLFYWKPEDFAQAYGTDDQEKLENKLTSNFKSFGDLVLELLQKSKKIQEGTPSLT